MIRIHGMDLSLNHGSVVELTNGLQTGFWYYTDSAGVADRGKAGGIGFRMPVIDTKERQLRQMVRLAWIEHWLDKQILVPRAPDFVGVEDYALHAEQGAHYLGELGGTIRLLLWFRGVSFRLHDPISVKMFATHDGTAQKDAVEDAVYQRWGQTYGKFNNPAKPGKKQNRTTSEDLADAHAIARLVEAEVALRDGRLTMDGFHPKEIQVFNRVTKTYPVNLLGREWIKNPDGKKTPHGRFPSCSSERCTLAVLDGRGKLPDVLKAKLVKVK